MKPILSDDELIEITGRTQGAAQARVLKDWRVPFQRRPDGSLAVGRAAFDAAMAGSSMPGKATASNGLNWSKRA
jgi:hypothetical protein